MRTGGEASTWHHVNEKALCVVFCTVALLFALLAGYSYRENTVPPSNWENAKGEIVDGVISNCRGFVAHGHSYIYTGYIPKVRFVVNDKTYITLGDDSSCTVSKIDEPNVIGAFHKGDKVTVFYYRINPEWNQVMSARRSRDSIIRSAFAGFLALICVLKFKSLQRANTKKK